MNLNKVFILLLAIFGVLSNSNAQRETGDGEDIEPGGNVGKTNDQVTAVISMSPDNSGLLIHSKNHKTVNNPNTTLKFAGDPWQFLSGTTTEENCRTNYIKADKEKKVEFYFTTKDPANDKPEDWTVAWKIQKEGEAPKYRDFLLNKEPFRHIFPTHGTYTVNAIRAGESEFPEDRAVKVEVLDLEVSILDANNPENILAIADAETPPTLELCPNCPVIVKTEIKGNAPKFLVRTYTMDPIKWGVAPHYNNDQQHRMVYAPSILTQTEPDSYGKYITTLFPSVSCDLQPVGSKVTYHDTINNPAIKTVVNEEPYTYPELINPNSNNTPKSPYSKSDWENYATNATKINFFEKKVIRDKAAEDTTQPYIFPDLRSEHADFIYVAETTYDDPVIPELVNAQMVYTRGGAFEIKTKLNLLIKTAKEHAISPNFEPKWPAGMTPVFLTFDRVSKFIVTPLFEDIVKDTIAEKTYNAEDGVSEEEEEAKELIAGSMMEKLEAEIETTADSMDIDVEAMLADPQVGPFLAPLRAQLLFFNNQEEIIRDALKKMLTDTAHEQLGQLLDLMLTNGQCKYSVIKVGSKGTKIAKENYGGNQYPFLTSVLKVGMDKDFNILEKDKGIDLNLADLVPGLDQKIKDFKEHVKFNEIKAGLKTVIDGLNSADTVLDRIITEQNEKDDGEPIEVDPNDLPEVQQITDKINAADNMLSELLTVLKTVFGETSDTYKRINDLKEALPTITPIQVGVTTYGELKLIRGELAKYREDLEKIYSAMVEVEDMVDNFLNYTLFSTKVFIKVNGTLDVDLKKYAYEATTFREKMETLKGSFWTGTIKGNVPVVIGYEAAIFDDVVNPVAAFELTLKPQIEFAPSDPTDKDTYTIEVDGVNVTYKDVTTRTITAEGSMTLDHEAYFKTTTLGEDYKFPFYTKKNNVNIFNSDKYQTVTVITKHKKTCSPPSK